MSGAGEIALKVRGLSAGYHGRTVLSGVDVDIRCGAITGLIGPNGAGKSTFIKAILGEIPATGSRDLFGRPLRDLREIAYVPQRSGIDFTFPITAAEVAVQGTYAALPWWRRPGRAEREWALECLEAVGMADHAEDVLGELSGGQAARVFIARALAQRPRVFLLDEPFAAIDATSQQLILDVLTRARDAGNAVVIVHHNLDDAPVYFDDLIVLNRAVIAAGPTARVLTPEVLDRAFPTALALAKLAGDAGGTGERQG